MHRNTQTLVCLSAVMLCLIPPVMVAQDATFLESVRQDTERLCVSSSRVTGSAGNATASAMLLQELQSLNAIKVWTHEFPVTMPILKHASITIHTGPLKGVHAVYPVWPDMVRLKTTGAEGINGRVLYVGDATIKNIPAKRLSGHIAAMEMSSYENWKMPFSMKASALLLLGSPDDKLSPPALQGLYFPRYYIPEGELADHIRNHGIENCKITCDAEWDTVTAKNYYALAMPKTRSDLPALALAAQYDSMSIVMDRAPGADAALDAALLLNLAKSYAASPPARPVLFAFIDAYSTHQLGMRQFLTMLTISEADAIRKAYHYTDSKLMKEYDEAVEILAEIGDGKTALEKLWNKRKYRVIQRYIKDVVGPELLDTKVECGDLRQAIFETKAAFSGALSKVLSTLPEDHPLADSRTRNTLLQDAEYEEIMSLLNRDETTALSSPYEGLVTAISQIRASEATLAEKKMRVSFLNQLLEQVLTRKPLSDSVVPEAERVMTVASQRILCQAEEQRARLNPFEESDTIRNTILDAMGIERGQPPVSFVVGIDISDAGFTVGPSLYGAHLDHNATTAAKDFTKWIKKALGDESLPMWKGEDGANLAAAINRYAVSGSENPMGFNVGSTALLTSPAASFEMPAVTWQTLSGLRTKVDTPQDLFERLNWERILPQLTATRVVLEGLISDSNFTPRGRISTSANSRWRRPWGSVVRESVSETVPRTPMPGFLVTLVPVGRVNSPSYGAPGIRRNEFVYSRTDGGFCFTPTAGGLKQALRYNRVQAFKLNASGGIISAQSDNTSMIKGSMSSRFDLNASTKTSPARLLSFPCRELNGPEFFDPRFLEPLSSYSLIDPMTGGKPKRAHFSVVDGQMWGLLMPETRWQLILRAGTSANRMILMQLDSELAAGTMTARKAMQTGFSIETPLPSVPAHVSARDFYVVDEWRLKTFKKAGVTSKVLTEIHGATSNLLAKADQAIDEDDGLGVQVNAIAALANELRAYDALLATGSDVTRGAIFLMILIVPFSIAMERLLFACVKIGHRISMSAIIFSGMALLLWSFHPAFRITNQPLIIVMAFAVLILSLYVITMILRKFEADLDDMRSGLAESAGAQTRRGGVIGSAVWLGIANMRKRKLRTFLTAITIVLITFALLCFSSSSTYQDKRQFAVDTVPPPYTGILIKQPSMRMMHRRALQTVNNFCEGRLVVPRYWWTSKLPTWHIHARSIATGRQTVLKAALGLSPLESKLTSPDKLMAGWDVFSKGNACFISEHKAEELNVKAGDRIGIGGRELVLAGTFNAGTIEAGIKMLDGQSLMPFDFTIEIESDTSAANTTAHAAEAVGLETEVDKVRVPPDDLVIISADFAEELGGALRSIGIVTDDNRQAVDLVTKLSKIFAFPMYYSTDSGTNVIVATPLIPKIPRNLLTPLILAALIIFNTMLNSVAERKKEIHIYTSLGLAPTHVGMLFLAEAVTYGLMGSVFGYIAGQGVAGILTKFDLMGGITLNYSGSSVIMTMGMVIGVVVLSSIVPAIMAGRLASPSDEMKWVVPDAVDGVIRDQLPFTISREAAPGLTAFMHDYIVAHEEGSIGKFASANTKFMPPDNTLVSGLKGTLWLAPYDLGVRQRFALRIVPEDANYEDICKIEIEIIHGAGQMSTWWRQNRSFLGELRRQLLGWRKMNPERILQYIEAFQSEIEKMDK